MLVGKETRNAWLCKKSSEYKLAFFISPEPPQTADHEYDGGSASMPVTERRSCELTERERVLFRYLITGHLAVTSMHLPRIYIRNSHALTQPHKSH